VKKIVFVDRDGTIIREPRDGQVDSLEKLEFLPGIIAGLRELIEAGFSLVMVSNQDGLGTPKYPLEAFKQVQKKILTTLTGEGINFEKVFICPHRANDQCKCRKPKLGLVDDCLRRLKFDREHSFVLGDRVSDVDFGNNLGLRSVLLTSRLSPAAAFSTPDALDACRYIVRSSRSATVKRRTEETDIEVQVALEGTGQYDMETGIGFFDHMLAQLAKHSGIDCSLKARGDLHVDEHHTIEDVGIVLGRAIRRALGKKRGIERFAAPLDESVAHVVLDLSGRGFLSFKCAFRRERVGDFPTELVEEFFRAFARELGATLHVSCTGRNDHHKIEAIFKSVARALKSAVARDRKSPGLLPSTKGIL
jgi:imidazoleglycerol-phosphate dehydratase/histidinol-phosphatase